MIEYIDNYNDVKAQIIFNFIFIVIGGDWIIFCANGMAQKEENERARIECLS